MTPFGSDVVPLVNMRIVVSSSSTSASVSTGSAAATSAS
jgi:hypothetical protein